jgi:zinc transporter
MSGFAYRVTGSKATSVAINEALHAPADFIWVHLNSNSDEAKQWLSDEAKLPDYVVEALTATETRPRCETIGDGAILNLRGRSSEAMAMSDLLASIRIWAVAGQVISVTRNALMAMDQVIASIEAGRLCDPGDLIAEFAIAITAELDPDVANLGDLLDDCEADLNIERIFELRRQVTKVRATSIGYRRFLAPQRAAIEKLAALPVPWLHDDDRMHLNAAADRAARMAEELESIRERAALMHEALTDLRAEQIDQRALLISVVAMIFLPLTFLTGLLGMNVDGIPYAHAPWAFDAVVLICILIAIGITGFFIRWHWFPD